MNETRPTHRIAANLRDIQNHATELIHQAINHASARIDGTSLPGGDAMIALAPVANQEAWEHRYETAERLGLDTTYIDAEDDNHPPLQTLRYWSDRYRAILGAEWDHIPTIATETNFLRFHLDWIAANEPMWDHFENDIRNTKTQLENLLAAGTRTETGVPCLSCNVDLIRPTRPPRTIHACDGHDGVCTIPHAACPHDRGGLRDEWVCPSCERRYDEDTYRRAVAQQAYLNAEWLPLEDAIARTDTKRGTIQGWASRGHVRKRKDQETGRMTYSVPDIIARKSDPEEAA